MTLYGTNGRVPCPWPRYTKGSVGTGNKPEFGFTLVELLVVIGVIALLVALTLPAISRTQVSARSIACQRNLGQIGLALNLYTSDWHAYPLWSGASADPTQPLNGLWDKALLAYCGRGPKLLECPAWKWADVWDGGVPQSPPVAYSVNGFNFCYGYNAFGTRPPPLAVGLGLGGLDYPNTRPVPDAIVREPTDLIAVGDYRGLMVYQANGLMNPWVYVNDRSYDYLQSRHPQGANVTFCDAHVESLGRKKRWPLSKADSVYAQRWNNDHQPHAETWPP